ncbi:MAG: DUF1571 domain-containing protein [Planctomycetaceae bacterium]|jgi:hypothetical protein|nr:DUF1571 domain-containing protein [Planctomycetaceae bacterium]MBT4012850.1 DUF1571 domain-containing protein [Planctomycetaceae bacterium]MBT4724510.1 DUF1571 domain-containing protein [Planctomycetaceae bacterium]MBT4845859.1 DUF1571 domain-containing protein [Planctomycetaceae bacterium]MBT5125817.1 DUF1571 domain-containing protein [Planctomycetaceae bacterium]
MIRRNLFGAVLFCLILNTFSSQAQQQPVRVAVNKGDGVAEKQHPLKPAIDIAKAALINSQKNINDYTATLVKRERIEGVLGAPEYIYLKVRNAKAGTPFSTYMYFVKPAIAKGREVIYVHGKNQGKMCAHEGGTGLKAAIPDLWLDPVGFLAMKGQRYPVTEIGLENLIVQLIDRAERDMKAGMCKVQFRKGAMINKRKCTMIQVTHPDKMVPYDFHVAQIFIDDELQVPVRYVSYDWPETEGARPKLIEEYTYVNVKLNNGFKDIDFDINNPNYNFKGK